jgi:hypothetical protein
LFFVIQISIKYSFFFLHRIQTEGLGGLKPNTIVLCWPTQWRKDFDSYTAEAFIRKGIFLVH